MATRTLRSLQSLQRTAIRCPSVVTARVPRAAGVSTIASFKIPKVANEPNVSHCDT